MESRIPLCEHVVYKKDKAGYTVKMGETVYKNRILQHPPEFCQLGKIFKQIQDFTPRKDDMWLLDYSKSGTHWMVSILQLLTSNEFTPIIQSKVQTMVEASQDLADLEKMSSPRVLNTHMRLDFIPRRLLEQNKIVIMIRNPKSVAVSLYHHTKKLPFYDYGGTFHDFLPEFIEGHHPEFYGNWFDYVLEFWEAFKDKPNALFVFYEDLKKDPVKWIKVVSDFLGLDRDLSYIKNVAEKTSISSLRQKEKEMETGSIFGLFVDTLFRKGTTTDWKTHFTVAEDEMFDAVYEEKMKNYPDLKERVQFS